MTDWRTTTQGLQGQARINRKRGDALRRNGREDAALAEFEAGIAALDDTLAALQAAQAQAGPAEAAELAAELVEAHGARGGLLRRAGRVGEALASYHLGAEVERRHVGHSTYNRVNEVKLGLISSQARLAELQPEIAALEALLSRQLAEDQSLGDNAWSWADLGDCRALLGDVAGAERAYRSFVEKAGSQAPSSTLEVLRQIVGSLRTAGDAGVDGVAAALAALESRLA